MAHYIAPIVRTAPAWHGVSDDQLWEARNASKLAVYAAVKAAEDKTNEQSTEED